MVFTGLGSVRKVKNCNLGLKSAVLRPRKAFSRPRTQILAMWTSKPANNINVPTSQLYIYN